MAVAAGRAGRLVIRRSLVQISVPGSAEVSKCPWARYWTPHCSLARALRWAGDLSREHPALALRQGWDWLQQQHPATPWKGISGDNDMTWHESQPLHNKNVSHHHAVIHVYLFVLVLLIFLTVLSFSLVCWLSCVAASLASAQILDYQSVTVQRVGPSASLSPEGVSWKELKAAQ